MSHGNDEPKRKNLNVKVSYSLLNQIDEHVEEVDSDRSKFVRSAIWEKLPDKMPILERFGSDLQTIADGANNQRSVKKAIEQDVWESLNDEARLSSVRELVFDQRRVVVVGQGSSVSVAQWLSQRLRQQKNVSAIASTAAALPANQLQADDVLVGISQSGETGPVIDLIDTHEESLTVAVTQPDTPLSRKTKHTIPLPSVDEKITPYATKSTIGQIAVLQVALLGSGSPDTRTLTARFKALDQFIDHHLTSEQPTKLRYDCPISDAVEALAENDDLQSTPIFAHTTRQSGIGAEMALKFSEFIKIPANSKHIGDVRDESLNLLYHNKAYLVGIIPYEYQAKDSDEYQAKGWAEIIYSDEQSIHNQFKQGTVDNRDDRDLPIIAFSFHRNVPDIVKNIRKKSKYGERSVMSYRIPPAAARVLPLISFVAVQLLTFGVLEKLWSEKYRHLDDIIDDVYTLDLIEWHKL